MAARNLPENPARARMSPEPDYAFCQKPKHSSATSTKLFAARLDGTVLLRRSVAVLVAVILMTTFGGGPLFAAGEQGSSSDAALREAMDVILNHFINRVTEEEITARTLEAMLKGLGDRYSEYLTPQELQEFRGEIHGTFGGIGVVIRKAGEEVRIEAVLPDTPAEAAGLRVGDVVLEVDGKPVAGMGVKQVGELIRGEVGSEVLLKVRRAVPEGNFQEVEFHLKRGEIHRKTVSYEMLYGASGAGPIGYIKISMFQEGTSKEFESAYDDLMARGMKGLILDLRDNLGGLLDECVGVAMKILPPGPVVYVAERGSRKKAYVDDTLSDPIGLCVLVNGMSASGSEIIAGAVQDRGTGVLIGTRTYGKGSVQTIFPLSNGGGLKITTARYFTPRGRSIEGIGLQPDVQVEGGAPGLVTAVTGKYLNPSRPLRAGSWGDEVEELQGALRQLGYPVGPADGRFGSRTLEALRRFQSDAGLRLMERWEAVSQETLDALRARMMKLLEEAARDKQLQKAREVMEQILNGKWGRAA